MAKKNIEKEIKKAHEELKNIMRLNLGVIAESMINKVIRKADKLNPSQMINATKDIKPSGINQYKSDLKAALAVISSLALDQARLEVPAAKKVKLMENEERLLFGEFEKLPPDIRRRINRQNELLIGTQISDLEKALFFQFGSSLQSDKPIKEIQADMTDKAESYIQGPTIAAGSSVVAGKMVNEARSAFFFKDDVLREIQAFQFMNGDPVSPVCQDLDGTIFRKDDPNAFRYTPPLHYNCKSWIRPIISEKELNKSTGRNGKSGSEAIERFEPRTQKARDSIQFSDNA